MEVGMRRILSILMVVLISACGGEAVKSSSRPTLVRSSATSQPDWILKKKRSPDFLYFVGMSQHAPDLKTARRSAIVDATSQLVENIGFRATSRFESRKETVEADNLSAFRQSVVQSLEGQGSAQVAVDVDEIYSEEYSDGTYAVYVLLKIPGSWIEKERERITKLTADQRNQSRALLDESTAAFEANNLAKSLDYAYNALLISEKASENQDIYDEAKNRINLILSTLSLVMPSTPRYAYLEGGSDDIVIQAVSSRTGTGVSGLNIVVEDTNLRSVVSARNGQASDSQGQVFYRVDKPGKSGVNQLGLIAALSLNRFETIRNIDPEYYQTLLDWQKRLSMKISLQVISKMKVIPTTLIVYDVFHEGGKVSRTGFASGFEEKLQGTLANQGFNILAAEIPVTVIPPSAEEVRVKESVLSHLRKNYPGIKRVFIGIRDINPLGKVGEDIQFQTYNINGSGRVGVEVKFVLSLLDVSTGTVEKGIQMTVRGSGLNAGQALEIAERKLTEQLQTQVVELE